MLSPSVVSDSATPWTVARQAPLSMGFSRQEYWSGLPCSPPGNLPDPGTELSHTAGGFFTDGATREAGRILIFHQLSESPLSICFSTIFNIST